MYIGPHFRYYVHLWGALPVRYFVECFLGIIKSGIKDIVGFHGTTVDELEKAFHESVDNYLAICEETGRPAQRPYSGKLMLRVSPEAHAAVATTAAAHGKSINQWAAEVLTKAARL